MSAEVIALVQTVSMEAIKVLGPAIIAAYAAYRAAFVQFKLKLQELEQGHQFQARASLFAHLKDRLERIDQQVERLNADLAHMLGFATGYQVAQPLLGTSEVADLMAVTARSVERTAPLEIAALLSDMRVAGLASSDEFKALLARQQFKPTSADSSSFETLKVLVPELIETYNLLALCTRLLLRQQMELVFAPYLAPKK
jgi:hypothetical protein